MLRIVKTGHYRKDPVLLNGNRTRCFTPGGYQDPAGSGGSTQTEGIGPQEDLLETARAQADRILADAEAKAAEIVREALARGYADGKAEGLRVADEQCRGYLERIAELSRRAIVDREAMVRSAERELAALALEIAAKVIRREVSSDPTLVLSMVEYALEKVGSADSVRILVHPDDADLVREKWTELRGAVAFGSNWEVIGDDQVGRGGCMIETKGGNVDSRIDTQLAEIVAAFEVGQ